MRFLAIVKASKESEAGALPTEKELREMGDFNDEMVKAGVMLAGEGLHPSSKGTRIKYSGKDRMIVDGPFPDTEDLVAGYWMLRVGSKQEAIDWLQRAPFADGEVELRQVFETDDFGAELTPELREQEERQREQARENAARP